MCGIAGIFNLDGRPVDVRLIHDMTDKIAHRGPDGHDHYIEGNIALGHRRLAILDLSDNGKQPMMSANRTWVIVFNGCIYNFKELRNELGDKGKRFRSGTDTEVIAEGLDSFGTAFIERLNGMFAIGAWNTKEKALYLFRDRFGVKPLYYWFNGRSLVFASEIKSIITHPEYSVSVDPGALNEYFTFQNLFTFRTLFKDVFLLPQANSVRIDQGTKSITHHAWWDYDFSSPDEKMSFEDARNELKGLFIKSVERQMVADVPVGSYLSGGMDSGSISAVASQHVARLTTFTCGFDMSRINGVEANYDERRSAELMANYLGTEHYEQVMNAGDLRWALPKVVWHIEDLKVGMSYPNYYISRLASKFVKVCLSGTGGDELFGGYPWRYYRVFNSLNRKDFLDSYYGFWQRLVPDDDRANGFFRDTILKQIDINEPRRIFERVFTFNTGLKYNTPEQHIQNSLYFEIKTFLPGLLLVGDRLAMANGLEERFPFLDNDLVEFAQKIPVRHKLGNLQEELKRLDENTISEKKGYRNYNDGKNILRQAMKDFIPEDILNRKKQGFSAPDENWYRGENAEYVKEILINSGNLISEYIDPDYIKKILNEHLDQKINHRLLIWSLINFEWWCRYFLYD